MLCSNSSGRVSKNFAKQFSAKQLAFLPVEADEAAAKSCQDLKSLNSLSGLQVAFCWVNFICHNIFLLTVPNVGNLAPEQRSALQSSLGQKTNKIHAVLESNIQRAPKSSGLEEIGLITSLFLEFRLSCPQWRIYTVSFSCSLGAVTSRAASSSSQGVGLVSRGEHIHQAAEEGNVGAVRHFLRVDPESLERKDGRSLGTIADVLVKSGFVRVPIGRLGSWLCGTTKLLWRHLRVQGRLSFCYPRFVYMNQVPDCRQSCVVTLLVFVLPDGVWWLSHPSHRINLAGHQQKCQSHLICHMLWNSVLQACLQAYSKIPSLVWVLLAHRKLVQLVHDHALECWRTKAEFHPIAVFKFLGCQIKAGYICGMIGSGFRVMFAF